MQVKSNEYFQKFNCLEQVKDAKTLTYKFHGKYKLFSNEMLAIFFDILKVEKTFRVLLHDSIDDELHTMIIAMNKTKYVLPHKHTKPESYHLIFGSILLIFFDDNGSIVETIKLSLDKTIVARVEKNQYHAIIVLSDYVVFNETRCGPFISETDSVFLDLSNEEKYMSNILLNYNGVLDA